MPTDANPGNLLFLTHPQVAIDPAIPVPDWTLSEVGTERMVRFAANPMLARVMAIYSSGERKAVDTARILSEHLGVPFNMVAALHENDRSATGYLPPEQFEAVADRFFAEPETSVLGWSGRLTRRVELSVVSTGSWSGTRHRAISSSPPTVASAPSCWRIFSRNQSVAVSINPDPAVATFSLAGARLWNCSMRGIALM